MSVRDPAGTAHWMRLEQSIRLGEQRFKYNSSPFGGDEMRSTVYFLGTAAFLTFFVTSATGRLIEDWPLRAAFQGSRSGYNCHPGRHCRNEGLVIAKALGC
jgi:hypothetical protein